jgi:HD-like signal output (HDOD) protein
VTSLAEPITAIIDDPVTSTYDRLLDRINRHAQLPAMGTAVRQLSALSDDSTQRMNELANIILSDIYLTQRVLSLSNTVIYRTHPAPVTTVSKALMLLGLNKVRVLALSSTLLDNLKDSAQVASLKADFSHAIFSSILAGELARETGLADPEEAAIVAMFRHTGQLMLALVDFALLQKIRHLAQQKAISEKQALIQEAGFSLADLSHEILTRWKIPAVLIDAATRTGTYSHSPLALLSQCADQLNEVLRNTSIEQETVPFRQVISQYDKYFQINIPALKAIISNTQQVSRDLGGILDLDSRSKVPVVSSQPHSRSDESFLEPDENFFRLTQSNGACIEQSALFDVSNSQSAPSNSQALAITQMVNGLQDMIEAIANNQSKLDICRIALETLHRAFGFDRSLLCLADPTSGHLTARIVFGDINSVQRSGFRFDPKNQAEGLFAAICSKNVDVHIRQMADDKIKPFLPPWFLKHFPMTQSMVLFPVITGKQVLGLIYADRNQPHNTDFSAHELKILKTLRNQMIVTLRPARQIG